MELEREVSEKRSVDGEEEGRTDRETTEPLVDCDRELDCTDWAGKLRVFCEEPRCEEDIRSRTAGTLLSFSSFELYYEDTTVERFFVSSFFIQFII